MSTGIIIEQRVTYVHTQNDVATSFVKRLQLIVRPLLIKLSLPQFYALIVLRHFLW